MARRSLLATAAVPPASPAESALSGAAEWVFEVGAFSDAGRVAAGRFAETGARCRQHSDPAVAVDTRSPVLWIEPTGAGNRRTTPATNRKPVAVTGAEARMPFGGTDGEPAGAAASGEVPARASPSPSPSPGAGPPTLREAVRSSSPFPPSARVRPAARIARTEHGACDGYGSAIAEVDRMPEDPVALLHAGLIPKHASRHLRPARVCTSPTREGAA